MQPASIQSHIQQAVSAVPFSFVLLAFALVFPLDDLVALLVRLCLLALIVSGSQRYRDHPSALLLIGWLFLSVLWSINPSKSLSEIFPFCAYIFVYLVFRYQNIHETAMYWGLRLLVSLAILLSVYGVYQLLYGYDAYYLTLEQTAEALLPASTTAIRAWLNALSSRVFSRFALPSQFAVYLLMMFPVHAALIKHERRTSVKLLWGAGFLLNTVMFVYTKSFGAWLTFFGLVAFGLLGVLWQRRLLTWRTCSIGSLGLLLAGSGAVYGIGVLRGQHLWDLVGNNPLWFRLLNWQAAINMWRDHFFLGTGMSTFGILYPQYMPPGANESNYAHNSYLQIGVEYGLIGLLLMLWLIVAWALIALTMLKKQGIGRTSSPHNSRPFFADVRYASALGGMAFLLHNVIDFDLYVFPLGAIGVALLALSINTGEHLSQTRQQPHRSGWVPLCVGCGLLIASISDWQQTEASRQHSAARMYIQAQRYEDAAEASQKAFRAWPSQPAYHALAGSVSLFQQRADNAVQYFQTALKADPNTPWFHAGLAEAYLAEYNLSLAYVESRRAAELFPQKPAYAQRMQEIDKAFPAF